MKIPLKQQYPNKIKIGPMQAYYKVKFVSGKKWFGKCSMKKQTIYLNSALKDAQLFMTFLHEVLHAIEFELGLKIKHRLIYELEDGLYNFLIDNIGELTFK